MSKYFKDWFKKNKYITLWGNFQNTTMGMKVEWNNRNVCLILWLKKKQHGKKSILSESVYKFNLIFKKLPIDLFLRNRYIVSKFIPENK